MGAHVPVRAGVRRRAARGAKRFMAGGDADASGIGSSSLRDLG